MTAWEAAPRATVLRLGEPRTAIGRIRLAVVSPQEPAISEWPFRYQRGYSAAIVYSGRGVYHDENGIEAEVGAGSLILVFPGVGHWYGPEDRGSWSEAFVIFDGPLFELLDGEVLDPTRPVHTVDVATAIERLARTFPDPPPKSPAAALSELWSFASLLTDLVLQDDGGPADDPVVEARHLLETDLAARESLPDIAAYVGLGYETFRHRFVEEVGVSPAKYRDRRRMAAAVELLRSTRLPQRDIAAMLGFADEFHFSKRFRSLIGRPPGTVRREGSTEPGVLDAPDG